MNVVGWELSVKVVRSVHIEPHHIMKRRAIDQGLKIHLHYDSSIETLTQEQQRLIKVGYFKLQTIVPNIFWMLLRRNKALTWPRVDHAMLSLMDFTGFYAGAIRI